MFTSVEDFNNFMDSITEKDWANLDMYAIILGLRSLAKNYVKYNNSEMISIIVEAKIDKLIEIFEKVNPEIVEKHNTIHKFMKMD